MNEESDVHLGHEHLLDRVLPLSDDPEDILLSSTDSGIACDSSSCGLTPNHKHSRSRNRKSDKLDSKIY